MTTSRPRPEIDPSAPAILVVEDDRRMAAFLDRALSYAGYRVAMVEDGEQALAQAEAQTPDLVLLDVMLPGIDGLEVARRLRAGSGIPILMLTAREGLDDRIEGLDAGADDYLAKNQSQTGTDVAEKAVGGVRWDGGRRRGRRCRRSGSAEPVNRFETPGAGNY